MTTQPRGGQPFGDAERGDKALAEEAELRLRHSRRRITGDVTIQVLGRGANILVSVVITAILVRSLGDRRYGEWATLLAIQQITGNFGQLGLQQTTVRQITLRPDEGADLLGAALVIRTVCSFPLALVCAGISAAVSTNGVMRISGFLFSATLIALAPQIVSLIFQARLRNDLTVLANTVNTIFWSAAVILVARAHGSMIGYAAAYLVVYTLTSVLQTAMARRLSRFGFARVRELSRPMIRLGLPLGFSVLLALTYARIDQVFVFSLAGAKAAGLYGAVFRIFDQAQFIPLSLMTTVFPLIVAVLAEPARLKQLVRRTSDYLWLVAAPALGFGIAAGTPVVVFLFGRSFAPAGPALSLLMVTYVILSYSFLYSQILIAFNLQGAFMRFTIIGLVVNVVLNLLLVPAFGFMAAASVTVVTQLIVLVLTVRRTPPEARALPTHTVAWGSLVAAAVMSAVVVLLRLVAAPVPVMLVIAPVIYVAAAVAVGAIRPAQVRDLLGQRLA